MFKPRNFILLIILSAYISSWFLPCLTFAYNQSLETFPGWKLAFMGLLGIFNAQFASYANFFYFPAAVFTFDQNGCRYAKILALAGLLLTLQTFKLEDVQENGPYTLFLMQYEIGFYIWLLSFVLLLIYTLVVAPPKVFQKLFNKNNPDAISERDSA